MNNQEAIETLKANYPDTCYEQLREAVDMAISALQAQDVHDANVGDMISRHVAIDAFYKHPNINWTTLDVLTKINALPSAQPEIIRCKDCIWYELPSHKITENCVRWMKSNGILLPIKPDDFCSRAERRTDE